jgi:hypothetical protein
MRKIAVNARGGWRWVAVFACLFVGCMPSQPKRDTSLVEGIVTYNGEPLTMGQVIFQPESGPYAAGDIEPDGTYSLNAVTGLNHVQIISCDPEEETPIAERVPGTRKPPKSHIPERYSSGQSPLSFEVTDSENLANFDLK